VQGTLATIRASVASTSDRTLLQGYLALCPQFTSSYTINGKRDRNITVSDNVFDSQPLKVNRFLLYSIVVGLYLGRPPTGRHHLKAVQQGLYVDTMNFVSSANRPNHYI